MKKKLVMRKWVEVVLLIMLFVALIIGMSECDNELIFIVSHFIDIIVLGFIGFMFLFYGRESDE